MDLKYKTKNVRAKKHDKGFGWENTSTVSNNQQDETEHMNRGHLDYAS